MPKRKAPDMSGTWIAVGAGGGSLLMLIIVVGVGMYMYSQAGEQLVKAPINLPPPAPPQPVAQPEQPKFKDIGDKKRNTTSYRARVDRIERRNELRNIGLFYQQYNLTFNRPPKTVQDFTQYIKEAPGIVQAINEKYYFIVVGVREGGSNIVAYEFDPDQHGMHGVAEMGGRAHDDMTSQELVAQLKAQGSQ